MTDIPLDNPANTPWGVLAPAAWWSLSWLVAALLIAFRARKPARADAAAPAASQAWSPGIRTFALLGALALAAAPIPALLQYVFSDRIMFWAGLPLFVLGVGLWLRVLIRPRTSPAAPRPRRFSFREKSAAVTIVALLLVYGWFSVGLINAPAIPAVAFGALVGSSVLITLIMIVSHIALALIHPPEKTDERDRLVTLKSAYAGHWVLAVGVWGVLVLVLVQAPHAIVAYALMGSFVLSELVRLGFEIVHYRYGA